MKSGERGSALLIAMLMALIMAVLGVTFLGVALADRKIAANEADAAKAFSVSEAGIEDARAALATTDVDTLLAGGGHLFTGSTIGDGTYTVDVANNIGPRFPTAIVPEDGGGAANDTDRLLVLTSTGTIRKAVRKIETVVIRPESLFNYGVWCDAGAAFGGTGVLDAYNSSVGVYGGVNQSSDADAFCNEQFDLWGSSLIDGNCTVGDDTCPDARVSGTRTTGAPTQSRSPVACPAGGYPAIPLTPGVLYNAATGALVVSGNLTLPTPPTTYHFSSVKLQSGGTLTLSPAMGQHVDLYVSGQLDTSGGTLVNASSNPTRLTLFACGGGSTSWKLSGGLGAHFGVYAPSRDITLDGGGPIYGAIVGNAIDNGDGSKIHYDHALAASGIPSIVPHTWKEIIP